MRSARVEGADWRGCGSIASVVVPRSVHTVFGLEKLSDAEKGGISFHEYPAKNVGIRRAIEDGHRWVLVTNPDVLFSESLVEWLSGEASLAPAEDVFYRLDRYDFLSEVPRALPRAQAEAIARGSVASVESQAHAGLCDRWSRAMAASGEQRFEEGVHHLIVKVAGSGDESSVGYATVYGARDGPVSLATGATMAFCKVMVNATDPFMEADDLVARSMGSPGPEAVSSCERLHVNAPGDFLLAPASAWARMRGFGELPRSGVVDSVAILLLAHMGLKQQVLAPPLRIYHMDHSRDEQVARPQTIFRETFVPICTKHFGTDVNLVINKKKWGHHGNPEVVVATVNLEAVAATLTRAEVEAKLDSLVAQVEENQRLLKQLGRRKAGVAKRNQGNVKARQDLHDKELRDEL
jgi:hypothetical protein